MARQNRVDPFGQILARPERGGLMGNRGGRLHDPAQRLGTARWRSKRWICCQLAFKGRRREVMGAGYTELFFLDEWTALAAGHRPCFECRRPQAQAYAAAWARAQGLADPPGADAMDQQLHEQRLAGRAQRQHEIIPDLMVPGVMIALSGAPCLIGSGGLWRWRFGGYEARALPISSLRDPSAVMLTPPASAAALAAGYRPLAGTALAPPIAPVLAPAIAPRGAG